MPRPSIYTPAYLDNAHRLYLAGKSWRQIAEEIGGYPDIIAAKLRDRLGGHRPYRPACNAKPLDWENVIARFVAGESVLSLARACGCQRKTISDGLIRRGIRPRNRSEGMFTRMARTPRAERLRLTERAHAAVRGSRKTREQLIRRALVKGRRIGHGEKDFAKLLRDRGFRVEEQAAIDTYNVDLLLNETVVVELRCEAIDPMRRPHQRKRIEHLCERGFAVVYILFRRVDTLLGQAEDLIADLHEVDGDPSSRGQHRVIRCGAERFARGRDDLGQFTAIPTPVRFRRTVRKGDPG